MNARKGAIADVLNLILAVWLFLSPWIVGFSGRAASNAWISAILVGVVAVLALAAFAEWEEWLNLVLGFWILASPWAVGFPRNEVATYVHLWTGIAIAILAAAEIWVVHRGTPRLAAGSRRR